MSLYSPVSPCAPTITRWQQSPSTARICSKHHSALLVVILVHTDQQADALRACCHPQGISDEDSLQGLQKSSTQVVTPEGVKVLQLCELDVTDDGT